MSLRFGALGAVLAAALSADPATATVKQVRDCLVEHATGLAPGNAEVSATVPDAEDLLRTIGALFGMDQDITIIPCGMVEKVESWAAASGDLTQELKDAGVAPGRYVVYNPTWVREVIGDDRDQAIFVFGHEYGHFVRGHFFERAGEDRVIQEGEADHYGGCAAARMGSSWSAVDGLIRRIRPAVSDGYYPAAKDASDIAKVGFTDCGGNPIPMCRVAENGVEKWGFETIVNKESNWRGGGGSQPGFCAEAVNQARQEHPNGSDYEVVTSSERTRETCRPFHCVEYQYLCTVRVKGDPVFLEAPCKQ